MFCQMVLKVINFRCRQIFGRTYESDTTNTVNHNWLLFSSDMWLRATSLAAESKIQII